MEHFSIKNITLSNYRKYENETFALNPHMNVFVGKNSSGKTTALEAACVMLGAYLAAYKEYVASQYVFNISDTDIMLKTNVSAKSKKISEVAVSPAETKQFPCGVSCDLQWDDKEISFQRLGF